MSDMSLSDSEAVSDSDSSDTEVGHILGHPSMPARTLIIPVVENGLPMLTAGIKMGIATVKNAYWRGVCVRVNHSWRIFGDIPRKEMQSEVSHNTYTHVPNRTPYMHARPYSNNDTMTQMTQHIHARA